MFILPAIMFILTQQTTKLPPQNMFYVPSDHLREKDKTLCILPISLGNSLNQMDILARSLVLPLCLLELLVLTMK